MRFLKGVPKKVFLSEMRKFVPKSLNKITNHPFKDVHDKIYIIGYYSAFYSSLTDKNCETYYRSEGLLFITSL